MDELESGSFREVVDDPSPPETVDTVVICSGKVYYDIVARRDTLPKTGTVLVRLEQLFPWPEEQLRHVLAGYPEVNETRWVQEESQNRGAWSFVRDRLTPLVRAGEVTYVGRLSSASPATGSGRIHREEQQELVGAAFDGLES